MLGNQFGKSSTYPVRQGAPNSQQVMSDSEFEADWQSRLNGVPQTVRTGKYELRDNVTQLVPGVAGWGGPEAAAKWLTPDAMAAPNSAYDVNTGAAARGASHTVKEKPERIDLGQSANPEYARMKARMEAALQQRGESQVANQQAYNGMLGEGQKNGVMGPGYSTPGFGRVDGQAENPYAVNMGANNGVWAEGYQPPDMTGVYDPVAQTKQNFWGL